MALTHSTSKIPTNGLMLYLDAANQKSYPGTGTTWQDLSSSKYTFTTTNSPLFTTDSLGNKCFEYSGAGKHFISTTNSSLSGNSFAISVVAVVNQFSTGSFYGILTQNFQNSTNSMGFLSLNGKYGTDHWAPAGRIMSDVVPNNEINVVSWVIPSWVTQKTSTKIYINSVEQPSVEYGTSTTGNLVSAPFIVGNWQIDRADMDFQGRIYSVMLYDRVLSDNEIKQIYSGVKSRFEL